MKNSEKLHIVYRSPKGRVVGYNGYGIRLFLEENGPKAYWLWSMNVDKDVNSDKKAEWVDDIENADAQNPDTD